jgi:N-acetyl-anhydromuramyl-L-alanine amidase AmpD
MPTSFNRRSKVLLALVVSMTLGSGLLLVLKPEPLAPLPSIPLTGDQARSSRLAEAIDLDATDAARANWQRVVIHRKIHDNPSVYHFVIEADGHVTATARWRHQQLSAGAYPNVDDALTIDVAVVGTFDREPPGDAQRSALGRLTQALIGHLGIDRRNVLLHRELDPSSSCPGPQFRFTERWDAETAL